MTRSTITLAAAITAILITGCAGQPDYRVTASDPQTVPSVDLERYAGLWYEIARYPNRFEEGCEGVTAEYRLRDDGKITVLNTCRQGSPTGPADVAEGVARVVGGNGAKLKVRFAPAWIPFAEGDYWVLHLEADYSAALVGDPSGKYLWILARSSQISGALRGKIEGRARALGYETDPLQDTRHTQP